MVGGAGLDARLFTDLSTLQPDRLITPSAEVFIRTAAPRHTHATSDWTIALDGFQTKEPLALATLMDALGRWARI